MKERIIKMKERIIKFRVWDIKKKKFIKFGNSPKPFLSYDGKNFEVVGDWDNLLEKDFVIQQFTGIKDKNGREIYEGDIVKALSSDNKYLSVVEWDESNASWGFVSIKCKNMQFSYNLSAGCSDWEVVGNILKITNY